MTPAPENAAEKRKLFCFGFGYTAGFLAEKLMARGWSVAGTTTSAKKRDALRKSGIAAVLFDRTHPIADPEKTFGGVTHMLFSVPPDTDGDPVFNAHGADIAARDGLKWAGYLSTTAVYGNQNGNWVDEETPPAPASKRGSQRLKAEEQWQSLFLHEGLPLHIFRLAGIYGPGRSALDVVRAGSAHCIDKPGHMFNRIHVADIVQALMASMEKPRPGAIYNLADDTPSPSHEVIGFACNLIGAETPPLVPFESAEMAPIVRSFYKDNKRVRNDALKNELGVQLLYPDYHSGLAACLKAEQEATGGPAFPDAPDTAE
ncbi:MAG: SDR family oxidoreductase [Alphaproteobacteria bacterium]|nr:SDR family oxidoreductase [Alphaproteobacteria bacterium]